MVTFSGPTSTAESFPIAQIYIPTKRRGTANADVVRQLAESIL